MGQSFLPIFGPVFPDRVIHGVVAVHQWSRFWVSLCASVLGLFWSVMDIIAWNAHGIGGLDKVRALRDLVMLRRPGILFLSETKCRDKQRFSNFRASLDFRYSEMVPCSDHYGGGLCLFWVDNVDVRIRSVSPHYIDAIVHGKRADGGFWWFTSFYGHPEPRQRRHSWDLLIRTLSHQHASPKWLVVGDCNEILFSSEKSGGPIQPSWQMDDFQVTLNDCKLQDLGYIGADFTWGNSLIMLVN